MNARDVDEVEDFVGRLVRQVLERDIVYPSEDILETLVKRLGVVYPLREDVALLKGLLRPGSERAPVVALDPDGVRRVLARPVKRDVLVPSEGVARVAPVVELRGSEVPVRVLEGRVQALEEGSRGAEEDARVGGAGVDLVGVVLELGDATDAV